MKQTNIANKINENQIISLAKKNESSDSDSDDGDDDDEHHIDSNDNCLVKNIASLKMKLILQIEALKKVFFLINFIQICSKYLNFIVKSQYSKNLCGSV